MGSTEDSIFKVNHNIELAYERRRVQVYALCLLYAAKALQYFRVRQMGNTYWENRTNLAKDTVFSKAFKEANVLGFFLSHTQQYGIYLELANNRQNEAIRPVINALLPEFQADLKKLYGAA